jgi:hypothetical protein
MAEVQYLPDTTKMRAKDRILKLGVIDDKAPKNVLGLTDSRLFTGDNILYAKMEPDTCLWYMQYEQGALPQPLKAKFTSFPALKKFAANYYRTRNIEITEVID